MKKDKDIIEIIVDEESDISDSIISDSDGGIITNEEPEIITNDSFKERIQTFFSKFTNGFKSKFTVNLSSSFIRISLGICVIVILFAAAAGILIPKNEDLIEKRLISLHEKHTDYISTKQENDNLLTEIDNLKASLDEKEKQLEEQKESQITLEEVKTENDELMQRETELKTNIENKQRALDTLSSSLDNDKLSFIELPNGSYKVPEDIKAGTYTVTGTGNLVIADSNKRNKVNKTLSSDGASYTLKDGDRVTIQKGKALFVPEQ